MDRVVRYAPPPPRALDGARALALAAEALLELEDAPTFTGPLDDEERLREALERVAERRGGEGEEATALAQEALERLLSEGGRFLPLTATPLGHPLERLAQALLVVQRPGEGGSVLELEQRLRRQRQRPRAVQRAGRRRRVTNDAVHAVTSPARPRPCSSNRAPQRARRR